MLGPYREPDICLLTNLDFENLFRSAMMSVNLTRLGTSASL